MSLKQIAGKKKLVLTLSGFVAVSLALGWSLFLKTSTIVVPEQIKAVPANNMVKNDASDYSRALVGKLLSTDFNAVHQSIREALTLDFEAKKKLVPYLVKAIEAPDAYTRARAVEILGDLGLAAQAAISALQKAAKNPELASRALASIGRIGPAVEVAIPDLIVALKDGVKNNNREVVWSAAGALGAMGPLASEAIPSLIALLYSDDNQTLWIAATALGKMGNLVKSSVPQLLKLLSSRSKEVRENVEFALAKIESVQGRAAFGINVDTTADTV